MFFKHNILTQYIVIIIVFLNCVVFSGSQYFFEKQQQL